MYALFQLNHENFLQFLIAGLQDSKSSIKYFELSILLLTYILLPILNYLGQITRYAQTQAHRWMLAFFFFCSILSIHKKNIAAVVYNWE